MTMLEMQLPGKIKQGRPNRSYLDVVKGDMQEVVERKDESTVATLPGED